MEKPTVVHDTFVLERTYLTSIARVFGFLSDPAKKRRWFAEGHGHDFDALGDATRRAIIDRLSEGPQSVSRLAGPLNITLTAVAQHLSVLQACGLARTEKVGRVRTCRIDEAGFRTVEQWIAEHRSLWT